MFVETSTQGFAVLNVMTGVFVNSAIKTREKDHETLMQNGVRLKDLVAKLWEKVDTTGLGQITISEFETMFEDEAMQAFFEAIEIKAVDAARPRRLVMPSPCSRKETEPSKAFLEQSTVI